jgi:hypothetical protein
LTEFCQANQFSKIEYFLASFAAFQEGKVKYSPLLGQNQI